jgi:hypothetical protein
MRANSEHPESSKTENILERRPGADQLQGRRRWCHKSNGGSGEFGGQVDMASTSIVEVLGGAWGKLDELKVIHVVTPFESISLEHSEGGP